MFRTLLSAVLLPELDTVALMVAVPPMSTTFWRPAKFALTTQGLGAARAGCAALTMEASKASAPPMISQSDVRRALVTSPLMSVTAPTRQSHVELHLDCGFCRFGSDG